MLRGVLECLEKKDRRVHVRGAKVRKGNVGRRTRVHALKFSKPMLNSGRIVRIVRRIIYVCVATVDGSDLTSDATEITPDITNIFFSILVFAQNGKRRLS